MHVFKGKEHSLSIDTKPQRSLSLSADMDRSKASLRSRSRFTPAEKGRKVMKNSSSLIKSSSAGSRQSPSFSASSSLSSSSSSSLGGSPQFTPEEHPLFSPATPLRYSGVPFSWEKLPGIPKKQMSRRSKDASSLNLLPLPPSGTPPSSRRFNLDGIGVRKKVIHGSERSQWDPFVAALVQCSKDSDDDQAESTTTATSTNHRSFWTGAKVSRSISDRFGFIGLYSSCKRTCAISESIIYLPRSNNRHLLRSD